MALSYVGFARTASSTTSTVAITNTTIPNTAVGDVLVFYYYSKRTASSGSITATGGALAGLAGFSSSTTYGSGTAADDAGPLRIRAYRTVLDSTTWSILANGPGGTGAVVILTAFVLRKDATDTYDFSFVDANDATVGLGLALTTGSSIPVAVDDIIIAGVGSSSSNSLTSTSFTAAGATLGASIAGSGVGSTNGDNIYVQDRAHKVTAVSASPSTFSFSGTTTVNTSGGMQVFRVRAIPGFANLAGAVSLTASSTLSATAIQESTAAVSLSSVVTASVASPSLTAWGTVAFTVSPTISVTGYRGQNLALSLTQTPLLTANAVRVHLGSLSMLASTSFSASAARFAVSAMFLSAVTTLDVLATRSVIGSLSLTALSTFISLSTVTRAGVIIMTAVTSIALSASGNSPASVTLLASPYVSIDSFAQRSGDVLLTVIASLVDSSVKSIDGAISLIASASSSVGTLYGADGSVSWSVMPWFSVTSDSVFGVVALTETCSISTGAYSGLPVALSWTATTELVAAGDPVLGFALIQLTIAPLLEIDSDVSHFGTVDLVSIVSSSMEGLVTAWGTVSLLETVSLTAAALNYALFSGDLSLTSSQSMSAAATGTYRALLALSPAGVITIQGLSGQHIASVVMVETLALTIGVLQATRLALNLIAVGMWEFNNLPDTLGYGVIIAEIRRIQGYIAGWKATGANGNWKASRPNGPWSDSAPMRTGSWDGGGDSNWTQGGGVRFG